MDTKEYFNLVQGMLPVMEEITAFVLAERDAFYDANTDQHGEGMDQSNKIELLRMDNMIDNGRKYIAKAKEIQNQVVAKNSTMIT
ncbi:MAG TPA: hypothetical protein ENK38_01975 [Gammaproteobacteria bacterium]|nr:hypothetical protein [Gammaproteobacteria bacterium]